MTTITIEQPAMPPHDLDAERAILGAVLLHPPALEIVGEIIRTDDFYDARHRDIYSAMGRLEQASRQIDHITVCEALQAAGRLQQVGGAAAVAELINAVASPANVQTHCRIVREKAQRRSLRRISYELHANACDEQESLSQLIEQTEQKLLAVESDSDDAAPRSMAENVSDRLRHLDLLYKRKIQAGLSTGLPSLDNLTAGFKPGNLIIVAARPAMGKTGLALTIAARIAIQQRLPVHVFSLEMTRDELTDRLLAMTGTVDLKALQTGKLSGEEWWRVAEAAGRLEHAPLHIDDRGSVALPQLRRRARRAKAKHGMALLVVDYLQLISPSTRSESRQQDISDISRGLKLLAKELYVPVVALSQLNRKVDDRGDQRPLLSDLRDSGAIEQDADVVMFIYRDEVYHKDSEDKGIAEILIRKQRNGPVGMRRLVFIERYAQFCELESVHQ